MGGENPDELVNHVLTIHVTGRMLDRLHQLAKSGLYGAGTVEEAVQLVLRDRLLQIDGVAPWSTLDQVEADTDEFEEVEDESGRSDSERVTAKRFRPLHDRNKVKPPDAPGMDPLPDAP